MSEAEEVVVGEFETAVASLSAATESQLPEAAEPTINVVSPDGKSTTEEQPIAKRQRIRYTKEELLALRNSPLVKRPDALPPESEWFGDSVAKRDKQKPSSDGTLDNEKSKNITDGLSKPKDEQIVSMAPKSPLLAVSKSPNGSAPGSPRVSDKIILGPPKMNFASSSVGGLKVVEEKSSASTTSRSNRTDSHRRTGDDLAYTRTSKDFEPRAPRGPTGGRGFVGREALRERHQAERVAKDAAAIQILNGRHTNVTRSHDNRTNRREGTSGPSRSKYHVDERSETPEWMNYNPQADDDAKKRKNGEDDEKFVDDIQAWKSKMKEQERKEKEKLRSEKDRKNEKRSKSVSRADISASWRAESKVAEEAEERSTPILENLSAEEKEDDTRKKPSNKLNAETFTLPNVDQLFGPEGIDIAAPLADSSAFDKFLSQHKMALEESLAKSNVAKILEPTTRDEGTSRFAKLFSHSTDEVSEAERKDKARGYTIPPNDAISPGAPITIATLFQSQNLSTARQMSPRTGSTEGKRMMSEDEVLQSLGARPFVKPPESRGPNAEDVAGINRVLEALAKGSTSSDMHRGPASLPTVSSSSLTSSSAQPLHQHLASSAQSVLPFNDPSIIAQKPASINKLPPQSTKTEGTHKGPGSSEVYGSDSMKRINTMFVGSIPTSVYRQLSSRSDNGSRESSAASSPAVKFNATKSTMANFSHSPNVPQTSTNIAELHAPIFKPPPPPPRSPVLTQQGPYTGMIAPYSNGHGVLHSNGHSVPHSNGHNVPPHPRGEYGAPPPLGRNIPVEQLFNMVPPRNAPPQFQQPGLPLPPHLPYSFTHQPDRQQQPPLPPQQSQPQGQQHQFSGPPLHQQQLNVPLHHPGMLPPGADAIFNMPGYAQFIPNIVNSGLAPNNIPTLPSGVNLQQRGMMTLEEIERRGMGGR